MICNIYCIEDINGLKYIGSTNRNINIRLIEHKYDKKTNKKKCSSKILDLSNCEISLLEECEISNKKEREKYWINKIDCVNKNKLTFDIKEYDRLRDKTKKRKKAKAEYRQTHNCKQYEKERQLFRTKKVCNGCYEFIKMLNSY